MKTSAPEQVHAFSIARFEAGDIEAGAFTHEAHIYVAWLYLQRYGSDDAMARFDAALRRLVVRMGAQSKYNAMVTWLFIKLIDERRVEGEGWEAFVLRNADLIDERPRA